MLLSAYEEEELIQAARDAGTLGYVIKRRFGMDLPIAVHEATPAAETDPVSELGYECGGAALGDIAANHILEDRFYPSLAGQYADVDSIAAPYRVTGNLLGQAIPSRR
jgi:hypothetical protein